MMRTSRSSTIMALVAVATVMVSWQRWGLLMVDVIPLVTEMVDVVVVVTLVRMRGGGIGSPCDCGDEELVVKLKGLVVLMVTTKKGSSGSGGDSNDDDDATDNDSNRVFGVWCNIEINGNIDMVAMVLVMMEIEMFNSN